MNITEGIRINDQHSYGNFGLELKTRKIGLPKKKSIRQTVPFMNGYYDYSALNGDPAWDERIIEYSFDVINNNPVELDYFVSHVLAWLATVQDDDIFDDTVFGYHWHGSYDNADVEWDDSGMLATINVQFAVHPFKIANEPITINMTAGTHKVYNQGMVVAPYVLSDASAAIQIGTYVSAIPANEEIQLEIDLARGENTVIVTGKGTVNFKYYEEVL